MATLQNESGTNLYPRTYTEKVFDKNGDAINDRVAYVGSEITGDTVAPITPYLNQSDIVNDLTTGGTTKPLSAEMGKSLNQYLSEMFLVERKVYQITTTTQQVNIAKSGYTPIGIVGYSLSHTGAYVNYMLINGNELSLRATNTTNFYGDLLYIKNLS